MTTTNADIVNRALQSFGSRTTVTTSELTNETSNEAIQANIAIENIRKQLLRMAPWDCAFNYNNLVYITSVPGTPENSSPGTEQWEKGQPAPPWAYEYQYPADCLRACFIVPQFQTGFSGGVPITTAVTGGAAAFWQGPPVKFKVGIDQFRPVTAVAVAAGGTGYAVGDEITLETGYDQGEAPIGAPARIRVLTVAAGAILTVEIITSVLDSTVGGSYFAVQTNPVAQGETTGSGTGATFNLTFGSVASQRVILTNQEFATLAYVKNITEIDIMDPLFMQAWCDMLGGQICLALTGDKTLANMCITKGNNGILEARKVDGNEGLTVNNVTPDWVRTRGINFNADTYSGMGFDWGGLWPVFQ